MLYQFSNNPPLKITAKKNGMNVIVTINCEEYSDIHKITLNDQIESGKLKIPAKLHIGGSNYTGELTVEVFLRAEDKGTKNRLINILILVALYPMEDRVEPFFINHLESIIEVI